MSNQLLPCPFCNAAMSIESNRDWHRIVGEHDERCLFMDRETVTVPATDEQLALAFRDWNRRATQPAAGEPVAVLYKDGTVLTKGECQDEEVFRICCKVETPLYAAPPAAAHGDEAVAEAIYNADRSVFMTKREYSELNPQTKARLLKMARAARGEKQDG